MEPFPQFLDSSHHQQMEVALYRNHIDQFHKIYVLLQLQAHRNHEGQLSLVYFGGRSFQLDDTSAAAPVIPCEGTLPSDWLVGLEVRTASPGI